MKVEIDIQHPDLSGVPGRAREILAGVLGWDRVRGLFPYGYEQNDPVALSR